MRSSICLAAAIAASAAPAAAAGPSLPHLRRQGSAVQLIVDGKPFLVRGGELGNSTASNPAYLASYWKKLAALNLNTVLAPVYWDLIEPEEGRFDFTTLDGLVRDARANGMRLVLLWFGSWKNFAEWARRYKRSGNPLLVPEAMRSPEASVNGLYAFGAHDAIGFAPFGVESIGEPAGRYLAASYDLVAQLEQ